MLPSAGRGGQGDAQVRGSPKQDDLGPSSCGQQQLARLALAAARRGASFEAATAAAVPSGWMRLAALHDDSCPQHLVFFFWKHCSHPCTIAQAIQFATHSQASREQWAGYLYATVLPSNCQMVPSSA